MDFFTFIVHVFTPQTRDFYSLERLWGDAERIEVGDEPSAAKPLNASLAVADSLLASCSRRLRGVRRPLDAADARRRLRLLLAPSSRR